LLEQYLAGQVAAGVDALQIFESWGAAFAPDDYREHVLPHVRRLVASARKLGVPVILFVRGNAALLEQAAQTQADVLGVDWGIELQDAIEAVGHHRVVQGNLDPMALFAPPDVLAAKVEKVLRAGAQAKAHIFNLGHGISRHTDPARVKELVELVHRGVTS
jgi:uroporphyrinogen decarboxylase